MFGFFCVQQIIGISIHVGLGVFNGAKEGIVNLRSLDQCLRKIACLYILKWHKQWYCYGIFEFNGMYEFGSSEHGG